MLRRTGELLGRLRTLIVMGALVLALGALNFFMGCDLDKEDPKPLYGVPPDSFLQDIDDPKDVYVDETSQDQMRAYYGPIPVDVDEPDAIDKDVLEEEVQVRPLYGVQVDTIDEVPDIVAEDQPMVYYGPVPVDVVEDVPVNPADTVQAWYGPQISDVAESTDAIGDHVDEDAASKDAMFYYGPVPYYGSQEASE
jgi:hypothetical protein